MRQTCSSMSGRGRAAGLLGLCLVLGQSGCDNNSNEKFDGQQDQAAMCDADNGSLILPDGFCAKVVADNIGFVRHIAVDNDGDIYAALRNLRFNLGGIVALRDTDGDERMDKVAEFADEPGIEIDIRNGWLYFGADDAVYRYRLAASLKPETDAELLISGFPAQTEHSGKTFTFDQDGHIYVNVGAPSNACQEQNRVAGVLGEDPCPELERHAGIWQFDAGAAGQTQSDGRRYASGIRNAYAIAWSSQAQSLYILQHGRDQLHEFWPQYYSESDGADLPAEELIRVEAGTTYSWPYCYYDARRGSLMLAPEYGGDGETVGRCSDFPEPVMAFPAHYSPNDMLFYEAGQFPAEYRHGAFVAFHGSYNRSEFGQLGYQVVFVPFEKGAPVGEWRVFADGFAGDGDAVNSPEEAEFRPTGLAVGPDGSLYVADSVQGRIWRIRYIGTEKTTATD